MFKAISTKKKNRRPEEIIIAEIIIGALKDLMSPYKSVRNSAFNFIFDCSPYPEDKGDLEMWCNAIGYDHKSIVKFSEKILANKIEWRGDSFYESNG